MKATTELEKTTFNGGKIACDCHFFLLLDYSRKCLGYIGLLIPAQDKVPLHGSLYTVFRKVFSILLGVCLFCGIEFQGILGLHIVLSD